MNHVLELLCSLGIDYLRRDHAPVFTCDEAARELPDLPGARCKNLFLRDRRGRRHLLLVIRPEQVIDLQRLGAQLGMPGLALASPRRLERYLGVLPGAVSLLALVNDTEHAVETVVDASLWRSRALQCHPLTNTVTLVIPREDIERVLARTGHRVQASELPERATPR